MNMTENGDALVSVPRLPLASVHRISKFTIQEITSHTLVLCSALLHAGAYQGVCT
jgi:hypothetical protein